MRFNINKIGSVLCVFLLTSCVYTKFEVYKSFENIETNTRYYKVEEKDGVYKWVEIGIHTFFGAGRKDYLTVSFKEELPKNLTIKSSNFGNITINDINFIIISKKNNTSCNGSYY